MKSVVNPLAVTVLAAVIIVSPGFLFKNSWRGPEPKKKGGGILLNYKVFNLAFKVVLSFLSLFFPPLITTMH